MAYIETALVSSAGRLLIQLDDGTVIDAGYVRGGPGPAGKDGQDGAPGIPGAKGDPGVNGAKWHTGVGAPDLALGDAGDLYMDVANALLPIFQKVGRDWIFLANLKVPPSGGGGGQSGAAGGGGSVIIYPKPDGGAPPDKDNDGQPIDKGDLWFDPNTGYLWIYNGTNWVPIGERPPVSVQPTPPLWNSSGDTNNRYPLVEGDLWFDSDQLALYVAAYDVVGDLRWVITTPADRSVLQDEVDIPDNPFVFPSPIVGNGGNPFDGMTVYNDTTKLWYVYNANKNQWIDLPPGVNELSLTAYLVRGADGFDETFEFNQADRDRLGTNALCYVDADDHDAFTRIVIPDFDTAGFDWSFILRGLQAGDQLTLIQKDETDPDDIFPFRSDYLTVGEITENSESFNTAISFESEQPNHVPLFDEPVLIRFKAVVNTGEDEIYYQETAPDPITNPELSTGNIWIDSDDNKLYVWNGNVWSEVTACTGQEVGDYVLKKGDTMTGALTMDNADHIHMVNTDLDFQPKSADTGAGWDANVDRFLDIESMSPKLVANDGTETNDHGDPFGINFDIDDGNTWKNRLKVSNRFGEIVTVFSGSGAQIKFGENQENGGFVPNLANTGLTSGIPILGIPTPDFDNSPDDIAVNKEYVDQRDEFLQNEIIELEEELEALAPSTERGFWNYASSGTVQTDGFYTLYDQPKAIGGGVTTVLADAQRILFNELDNSGTKHEFSDTVVGDLLELFEQGDEDTALYKIESKDIQTAINAQNGQSYTFIEMDLSLVKAYPATAGAGGTARFKIFKAPTGGDASAFVQKIGDKMTGNLEMINSEFISNDYDPNNNTAHLEFSTKSSSTQTDRTVRWWQPGYVYITITDGSVVSERDIVASGSFKGGSRSGSTFTYYDPAIKLEASEGSLLWGTDQILTWDDTGLTAHKPIQIDFSQYEELS